MGGSVDYRRVLGETIFIVRVPLFAGQVDPDAEVEAMAEAMAT
jgi:hypothetical protein